MTDIYFLDSIYSSELNMDYIAFILNIIICIICNEFTNIIAKYIYNYFLFILNKIIGINNSFFTNISTICIYMISQILKRFIFYI